MQIRCVAELVDDLEGGRLLAFDAIVDRMPNRRLSNTRADWIWESTALSATDVDPFVDPADLSDWRSAEAVRQGFSLGNLVPAINETDFYICGPTVWTDAVGRDAREYGAKNEQIHAERFSW